MTVPRSKLPASKHTYSDGDGGTLTEEEWLALPPAERERMQKLTDERIKQVTKGGTI
jgi:hypothetical protein